MNTLRSKSNSITSNNIETDFFTTERMGILTTPDMEHINKSYRKIAAQQIVKHTTKTRNLEAYQSTYRENHSMEMALIKVKSNILNAIVNKEVTCLILLNLSTAFDTISHPKLLNRLKYCFGIVDVALKWIQRYPSQHTQKIVLNNQETGTTIESGTTTLKQGVLQGLVLGPLLYTLYISLLGNICR